MAYALIIAAILAFGIGAAHSWLGERYILIAAASVPATDFRESTLLVIAVTFFVSAVVAGVASRGRHLSWLVFLAIAVLAALVGLQGI